MAEFKSIDFLLPEVKDFIFDLHHATRNSFRLDEVQLLYDVQFKDLSEKYFAQSSWPSPSHVASECYYESRNNWEKQDNSR